MALHDNPLWILSHIKNSFIVSDTTGNSELVLTNEVKSHLGGIADEKSLAMEKSLNPFDDESEEETDKSSIEIRAGRNPLRPRCNTERKLEKMRQIKKQQVPVQTVSWREASPEDLTNEQGDVIELFPKKQRPIKTVKESLLSMKIERSPEPVENPFADYSKFDAQDKSEFMPLRVFVPTEERDKSTRFVQGRVHPMTLVSDVIGFICFKYVNEGFEPSLKSIQVDSYSLYLADPDGSIDWDLRPIQKTEPISKFGLSDYALVNMEDEETESGGYEVKVTLPDGTYTVLQLPSKDISAQALIDKVMSRHKMRQKSGVIYTFLLEPKSQAGKAMDPNQSIHSVDDCEFFIVRQNSRRCAEFQPSDNTSNHLGGFYPIDATTYQEYRDIWLLTKIRSKLGISLAISQDRFDIFPHQTPSSRLWAATHGIPKEGSFSMENIVACEVTEKTDEDNELWTFRLVLEHKSNSYKKVYFQANRETVQEIHSKMSNLLHWHSSQARANYIVYKELKSRRRKTNLF